MHEKCDEEIPKLRNRDLSEATSEQLECLKKMSYDQLLRSSRTLDGAANVVSTWGLKEALQKEETAIKRLILALVIFTGILVMLAVLLVILTVILVWPENRACVILMGILVIFTGILVWERQKIKAFFRSLWN